ncbi:SURF1 family protein [Hoeflea sp. YIM 152468]|uniref:SURF1 family protein n=1 Tax=Hoeflea sp. YIM 152468 TaxID=3031759 RepID=UPI0023D9EB74|nr:SURF1 family protein [Hoeflea sp. YIM 152468]MDF1608570.1 SURF1 family protein [Hoeflea sp. YIM 152468]
MVTERARTDPPRRATRFWVGLVLLPVALAILLALGTWQVKRLYWKQDLLAGIEQRSQAQPVELDQVLAALTAGEAIDYRAARASGRYLHDSERHFFATFEGQSGYYVYTPLQLEDGRYLFVNRGFVPYDLKEATTRPQSLIEGEQQVTGLARAKLMEKPSFLVPENDEAGNIFYWKDLDRMAASTGLPADQVLPFFLDADATPVAGGLPRGGVTVIALPNSHLQYAVTWYGLALALMGVSVFAWLRRKS